MAKQGPDLGGGLHALVESQAGGTKVTLSGVVTELAKFGSLKAQLRPPVRMDLAAVERLNSLGVRGWVLFVRDCEASGIPLVLERVSPAMLQQLSMITGFLGTRSQVASLLVPYYCPSCSHEHTQLVERAPGTPIAPPPSLACSKCNGAMQLEEPEGMYQTLSTALAAQ